jgi:regulator of replication initiation timing
MQNTILLMQIQGLREKLANNTLTQTKKSKTKETAKCDI